MTAVAVYSAIALVYVVGVVIVLVSFYTEAVRSDSSWWTKMVVAGMSFYIAVCWPFLVLLAAFVLLLAIPGMGVVLIVRLLSCIRIVRFRSLLVGKQLTEEDVRRLAREEAKGLARSLVLVAPGWDKTKKSWVHDEQGALGPNYELTHAAGQLRIGTPLGLRPMLREDIQLANSLRLATEKDIDEATSANDSPS